MAKNASKKPKIIKFGASKKAKNGKNRKLVPRGAKTVIFELPEFIQKTVGGDERGSGERIENSA